jgi:CheY-like chemotaxis protein
MGGTILICDDQPVVRELLRDALSEDGFAIVEARDGRESLELARSVHPDLIVLDMVMPGLSGLDVLAELRSDPGLSQTLVVLCTGASVILAGDTTGGSQADRYLQKPFSPFELVAVIRELLGAEGMTASEERGRAPARDASTPVAPVANVNGGPAVIPTTVLLCDDEDRLRMLVRATLEGDEYSIVEAVDGDESLELARSLRPGLVVLDMMMPGRSGLDVVREIRSDPQLMDVPVLMLTARASAADRDAALEAGADRYLAKPFSPRELMSVVGDLLGHAR